MQPSNWVLAALKSEESFNRRHKRNSVCYQFAAADLVFDVLKRDQHRLPNDSSDKANASQNPVGG